MSETKGSFGCSIALILFFALMGAGWLMAAIRTTSFWKMAFFSLMAVLMIGGVGALMAAYDDAKESKDQTQ